MKLVPVRCQNCGASLEIGEDTRFVTCQFCNSQLAVQHTGSAMFTELLGDVAKTTGRLSEEVEALRIKSAIDELDREWMIERERHLTVGEYGKIGEPNAIAPIIVGSLLVWGGIVGLVFSPSFNWFAPFFIVMGLFLFIQGPRKARQFRNARSSYEAKRAVLQQQFPSSKSA
jgi:hypothetical protein